MTWPRKMPMAQAGIQPIFKSLVWLNPEKCPRCKQESSHRSAALEADALSTRPTRQSALWTSQWSTYNCERCVATQKPETCNQIPFAFSIISSHNKTVGSGNRYRKQFPPPLPTECDGDEMNVPTRLSEHEKWNILTLATSTYQSRYGHLCSN